MTTDEKRPVAVAEPTVVITRLMTSTTQQQQQRRRQLTTRTNEDGVIKNEPPKSGYGPVANVKETKTMTKNVPDRGINLRRCRRRHWRQRKTGTARRGVVTAVVELVRRKKVSRRKDYGGSRRLLRKRLKRWLNVSSWREKEDEEDGMRRMLLLSWMQKGFELSTIATTTTAAAARTTAHGSSVP
jgi:hypothetical protein